MVNKKINFWGASYEITKKGENKYIDIKINHTNKEKNIDTNKYKIMLINENGIVKGKYKSLRKNRNGIEIFYTPIHTGIKCNKITTKKISIKTEENYKILSIPYFLYCDDNVDGAAFKLNVGINKYSLKGKYKVYVTYTEKDTIYYSDTIPLYLKIRLFH
jgi:hypothetical protein